MLSWLFEVLSKHNRWDARQTGISPLRRLRNMRGTIVSGMAEHDLQRPQVGVQSGVLDRRKHIPIEMCVHICSKDIFSTYITAVRQLSKQIQLVRIFVVEGLQRPVTKQLV